MVVAAHDFDKTAIGLVAVSSMRGIWHNAEGEGKGSFWLNRLYQTVNIFEPKAAFGYAYNGHTAMMARLNGDIVAVVGWNPLLYLGCQISTMYHAVTGVKNRFTCPGKWYNDQTMIHDPTAISLEIPCTTTVAQNFATLILGFVGTMGLGADDRLDMGFGAPPVVDVEYTFLPAEMEFNEHPFVGQCTELAVIILCAWLYEIEGSSSKAKDLRKALFTMANSQNTNERNLLQGKMMQFIADWNGRTQNLQGAF